MTNPLADLKLVFDVVLKINEVAENVLQNRKDCLQVKSRVERVRHTLSLCENSAELIANSAVNAALNALSEILDEALKLVTECQEERSLICLCWTAGKRSKQLSKVDQGISSISVEIVAAILAFHSSKQNQDDPHRPPLEPVDASSSARDGEMNDQPRILLHQIAEVASGINAALAKVRQNKEDCVEIDRRTKRISTLLLEFENTETMEDPAMSAELKKLLETFSEAHKLVMACQLRRSIFTMQPSGELPKQLHDVLDKMVLDLDDMIVINVRNAHTMLDGLLLPTPRGSSQGVTPLVRFTGLMMVAFFVKRLRSIRRRNN